jgi:hypothetical protein
MSYCIRTDLFSEMAVNDGILSPTSSGDEGKQLPEKKIAIHDGVQYHVLEFCTIDGRTTNG